MKLQMVRRVFEVRVSCLCRDPNSVIFLRTTLLPRNGLLLMPVHEGTNCDTVVVGEGFPAVEVFRQIQIVPFK